MPARLGGIVRYGAVGVDMDLICQCLGELGGKASRSVLKSTLFKADVALAVEQALSVQTRHLDMDFSALDAFDGKMRLLHARDMQPCSLVSLVVCSLALFGLASPD
jgi:hypothetical protein